MAAWLEVLTVAAPATVQDGGRPGRMHHGVPPGGALIPELLAAANRAVGNPWDAAALETYGRLEVCLRGRSGWVAVDGMARHLDDGERWEVPAPTHGVVSYLAVDGGLDVPVVLGGRGTLLVARLGGLEGRPLRTGDRLPLGSGGGTRTEAHSVTEPEPMTEARVILGPDPFEPSVLSALLDGTFTVAPASDRVGMRLQEPKPLQTNEATGISRPMVRGAIQVPPSGEPIVLGPDHPTTGGYPVIATVIRADWGKLAALRPGATVRFRAVGPDAAREAWRLHAASTGQH